MKFARNVFGLAGLYGLATVLPLFFMEAKVGIDTPPPITHPEFYYGFAGVALAWQFAFFAIAREPVRLRPIMPFGAFEKIAFGVATIVLYLQGRLPAQMAGFGVVDLVFATLFLVAYARTPRRWSI